ncbi:HAD family hydrolase [Paraburkholderia lacunae]|uniref:HAD family hydrolase n=1 Tax=Paraburkholderia lacunae TaxID=2211104 RepID=A0A370MYF1_9BURK|nr:HAD hydrolase-like protein [Paraburkholderia lacunae]RDJ98379.1 hypothetical protein DLM46_33605 [Paraburkholderia lacunae]
MVCHKTTVAGYLKHDPRIFAWICAEIGVSSADVVMVGDTFSTDYVGATSFGMLAFHLDRVGVSRLTAEILRRPSMHPLRRWAPPEVTALYGYPYLHFWDGSSNSAFSGRRLQPYTSSEVVSEL